MCSVKMTLEFADGRKETFSRPAESGDGKMATADLSKLRTWMDEVQKDLNAALTEEVEKERMTSSGDGKLQPQKESGGANEDDDEDDDDEEDDDQANGDAGPPVKMKKT